MHATNCLLKKHIYNEIKTFMILNKYLVITGILLLISSIVGLAYGQDEKIDIYNIMDLSITQTIQFKSIFEIESSISAFMLYDIDTIIYHLDK
ncbi:MAG: hypothetical protein ACPKPY_12510 [Nitrososphaeraceae archaeon]